MADVDPLTGALLAAYAVARETVVPAAKRWGPTLLRTVTGRRAQDASTRLTEAQARESETRAEQTAAETWRAFAAEQRAQCRADREEDARRFEEARARDRAEIEAERERDRAECRRREEQLGGQVRELAERVARVARAAGVPSSPDLAVVDPRLDPSVTPVDGVNVEDPTPDLRTDPPGP